MVIIRKSDLTDYALQLGVWEALCDLAGVDPCVEELEIQKAKCYV